MTNDGTVIKGTGTPLKQSFTFNVLENILKNSKCKCLYFGNNSLKRNIANSIAKVYLSFYHSYTEW